MNRQVGLTVLLLVGYCGMSGCRISKPVAKSEVSSTKSAIPEPLLPPAGAQLVMRLHATGDQIYTVQAGANGAAEWSPATPDAKLFNEKGDQVGTHGKGPSWTLSDGGTVIGQLPPAKKLTVDPSAILWLEINAKPGTAVGSMKEISIIQRIKTTGGLPPKAELNAPNIGKQFKVPYTAEYLFYKAQ